MNKNIKEFIIYIIGMVVLSFGLGLNAKLGLGTSALMVLPLAISNIYNLNFGDITLIYYIVFIIIEIILHLIMKKYSNIIGDILQILVSVIFTRFLNIINNYIPDFSTIDGVFGLIYVRIIILLITIVIIGVGAALTLKTKLPPNPCDGIVKVISEFTKKNVGTIKNFIDIFFVLITGIFSYIVSRKLFGIGIGTIIAMVGVGRVIYYFNKLFGKKIDKYIYE